jgi:hypothetical protein
LASEKVKTGTAQSSFVTNALADIADGSSRELITDIQEVAATMYGGTFLPRPFLSLVSELVHLAAASDTTVSSIHSCLLALVLNPSVQTRAQAELDAVIGLPISDTFRLPTFSDRPNLPYIDAIVKESLRWLTVVATGVPHATTEKDVYRGWRIPKGSIMIANAWAMLHDPKTYADPFSFRPERFLPSEGQEPEPEPGISGAFGFGRRYAASLLLSYHPCAHSKLYDANVELVLAVISPMPPSGFKSPACSLRPDEAQRRMSENRV